MFKTRYEVAARGLAKGARHRARRARIKFGQTRQQLTNRHRIEPVVLDESGPVTLERLGPDATPEVVAAHLRRAGGVIIENLVDGEVMDAISAEMAPYVERAVPSERDFEGQLTKRVGALIARSPSCRPLVQHPTILGTVGHMLGHASAFQVHLTQIISIAPGEPAQKIHRDMWIFDDFEFPPGFEVQCNTIWAMNDFTEENGATRIVPGSNHAGNNVRYKQRDTVPATMTKGSVLLYTGSVYHGGGANRADGPRNALNLTYNLGWLRQEENQYLAVPHQVAKTLDDDLLRLIGYQQGAGLLGYVDDLRDPLDALRVDPMELR